VFHPQYFRVDVERLRERKEEITTLGSRPKWIRLRLPMIQSVEDNPDWSEGGGLSTMMKTRYHSLRFFWDRTIDHAPNRVSQSEAVWLVSAFLDSLSTDRSQYLRGGVCTVLTAHRRRFGLLSNSRCLVLVVSEARRSSMTWRQASNK
jgi:hypothetical protein